LFSLLFIVNSLASDVMNVIHFTQMLCLVHTCHKMAPLNGTILWRHKIAHLA